MFSKFKIPYKGFYVLLILLFLGAVESFAQSKKEEKIIQELTELFDAGKYDLVITSANSFLKNNPKNCKVELLKGRTLGFLEKYEEGLASLDRVIQQCPSDAESHFHKALILALIKKYPEAIKENELALKIEPNNIYYIKNCGALNIRIEDYEKAINYYDRILAVDPKEYECLVFRGRAKKKLKQYESALLDYNEATKINRDAAFAYEERGFLYLETNQNDKAVNDFKFLVESSDIDKESILYAYGYNNLGFAQFKNGQLEEALRNIDYSLRLDETNSYAFKNRALILLKMNDKKSACIDLNKAKELGYSKNYGSEVDELISQNCQ